MATAGNNADTCPKRRMLLRRVTLNLPPRRVRCMEQVVYKKSDFNIPPGRKVP